MAFNISVSIPTDDFDDFREHYEVDTIEDAAEQFKQEILDKREEIVNGDG